MLNSGVTIQQACDFIYNDTTGANGDVSRDETVDGVSWALRNFVCETLASYDIVHGRPIDDKALFAIGRLVARAMLEQHDLTDKNNGFSTLAEIRRLKFAIRKLECQLLDYEEGEEG